MATSHAFSEPEKLSFREKVKQSSFNLIEATKLRIAILKKGNAVKIKNALISGVKYGNQAKQDEANGYELAHEKAAYDWGYEVGDPKLVKMIRFFWEGVQLGIFAMGDYRESTDGSPTPEWKTLENMVGANGKEYTVDQAYINDIFHDVNVATAGATAAKKGQPNDFLAYAEEHLTTE